MSERVTSEAWIARPRVLHAVLSGGQARLTVVRAPSGYGKSVVLEQLREHLGSRAVLLRLADRHLSVGVLEHEIAGALAGADTDPFLLLDDYDALATSSSARSVLERLIFDGPSGLRLVVATRGRPALSLGRLRSMRALHEVGVRELAFTARELREVATDCWGLPAETVDVDRLLSLTAGWIGGAALTVDSIGNATPPRSPEDLPEVVEYFDELVEKQVPPETLSFATAVSLLDVLDPEICRRLTGDERAGDHLRALAERSIFTEPDATDSAHLRFHPLFRDYLRGRLRRSREPGDIVALHTRAADALAEAATPARALVHLLYANRPDSAAALLEEIGIGQLGTSSLAEIEELLTLQDGTSMRQHPWLMALLGRLKRLRNDFDGALAALNAAALDFAERDDLEGQAWVSAEVSQVRYRDDAYSGSVSRVRNDLANPALSPITRANLSAHLCWLLTETGPVDDAIAAGETALSRGTLIEDAALRSRVLGRAHRNLALAALYSGNVDRAFALVDQARLHCADDEFELAWTNVIAAAVLATRGELSQAQELLAAIIRRTTPYTSTQLRWAYWWTGNVLRAQGRAHDAQSAYQMAGSLATVDEALLRRGRLGPGLLVAVAGQLGGEKSSESVLRRAGIRLVQALARDDDPEASLAFLRAALRDLEESGHLLHATSIAAYRARLTARLGHRQESDEEFDHIVGFMIHNRISALPWGVTRSPEGSVSFADSPTADVSAFAATIERCPDPTIRDRLTIAHRDVGLAGAVVDGLRARGLTWREVDVFVLYYLGAGASLGDGSSIRDRTARTLAISEHTLKSHITRIRAKVPEAESREAARSWIRGVLARGDASPAQALISNPADGPAHQFLEESVS